MTNRFNITDIVVGVGMCAIVFGALLLFVAADGALTGSRMPAMETEELVVPVGGGLQRMLGQAIVEEAIHTRNAEQSMTTAAFELNRAMQAQRELDALYGGPLGETMRFAGAAPIQHAARVQGILGRHIVNFTKHGLRSGAWSRDRLESSYNTGMIAMTEARARGLDEEFDSTWQAMLGRRIVDAIQAYTKRADMVQAQLGSAIVKVAQSQATAEDVQSAGQYRVASLMLATTRSSGMEDQAIRFAAVEPAPMSLSMASASSASWPEIPIGVLMIALFGLTAVFLGGLSLAAATREAKAIAERQRDANRWVYRMAS